MEGQYPIKPYKRPKDTTTTTQTITGKMGKVIEIFLDNSRPEIVTFYIKSNKEAKTSFLSLILYYKLVKKLRFLFLLLLY